MTGRSRFFMQLLRREMSVLGLKQHFGKLSALLCVPKFSVIEKFVYFGCSQHHVSYHSVSIAKY
jgi:hypothetical protein